MCRTGDDVTAALSWAKAESCSSFHSQGAVFLVSSVKGAAIPAKPLINLRKKLQKPKNYYIFYTILGTGQSATEAILLALIWRPYSSTSCPRKVVRL